MGKHLENAKRFENDRIQLSWRSSVGVNSGEAILNLERVVGYNRPPPGLYFTTITLEENTTDGFLFDVSKSVLFTFRPRLFTPELRPEIQSATLKHSRVNLNQKPLKFGPQVAAVFRVRLEPPGSRSAS